MDFGIPTEQFNRQFRRANKKNIRFGPNRIVTEEYKEYTDWLRANGIYGVQTADEVNALYSQILNEAATKFNRRTPDKLLRLSYTDLVFLYQLRVGLEDDRSSDISVKKFTYNDRCLSLLNSDIVISEHAVRRYWQHCSKRPDIESWLTNTVIDVNDPTVRFHNSGLLYGELCTIPNGNHLFWIDKKISSSFDAHVFRIKTIIPVEVMNQNQLFKWYKAGFSTGC